MSRFERMLWRGAVFWLLVGAGLAVAAVVAAVRFAAGLLGGLFGAA